MLFLNDLAAPLHLLIIDGHILEVDALHDNLVVLATDAQYFPFLLFVMARDDFDHVVAHNLPLFERLLDGSPGEEAHLRLHAEE